MTVLQELQKEIRRVSKIRDDFRQKGTVKMKQLLRLHIEPQLFWAKRAIKNNRFKDMVHSLENLRKIKD